jgi:peroxiredoxin
MTKLTLKLLEEHQEETLKTLDKEYEKAWKEAQQAIDKVDLIARTKAKFQAQILMAQTKWKIDENN